MWLKDRSGATAIEYGLVAGVIGLAVMAGGNMIAGAINDQLQEITGSIAPRPAGGPGAVVKSDGRARATSTVK